MIVDLDHEASLDPSRVGAKAAWLAMGRRADLPVLPGFVVEAIASRHHMKLGAETLRSRGSGGARLIVVGEPPWFADELIDAGKQLGPRLVARSSTSLERSGEWSGTFTSYLDISAEDLPKAVVGCWASAFSVDALERQKAAGIEPGSFPMSVLVQVGLEPEAGGTATIDGDGTIVVHGVKGSPAPLLQGWTTGDTASWDDGWSGDALVELLGISVLDRVAAMLRTVSSALGANQCEWALDGEVWVLQLSDSSPSVITPPTPIIADERDPALLRVVRALTAISGPLGEELVLPWAVAGLPWSDVADIGDPEEAVDRAREISRDLTSQVWGLPADDARAVASRTIKELRGQHREKAVGQLRSLHSPDPGLGGTLIGLLRGLDEHAAAAGGDTARQRVGVGPWEPFIASVVLAAGERQQGRPASAGFGAGRLIEIRNAADTGRFAPRQLISSPSPLAFLAPLLWDSPALVTESGSPAAHLFDAARSLGVPSVSGVSLDPQTEQIVAVDGYSGTVASVSMTGEDDG